MTGFFIRSFPRKRESSSWSPLSRGRAVPLILAFCIFAGATASAQFGETKYAIKADDGDTLTNFDLGADLSKRLAALPGQVAVGNLNGDVTLVQFYDLNCPYCREAAGDVDALVRGDSKLKLIFVPYAVLSVQSVQGALIEIGASKMLTPEKYLDFHRQIYASRGRIDGPRVLAAAKALGLDSDKLAAASNTEGNLDILRESANFGTAAKLMVTPAYVISGVAILGHPGLKPLQKVVASVRACGKVVC